MNGKNLYKVNWFEDVSIMKNKKLLIPLLFFFLVSCDITKYETLTPLEVSLEDSVNNFMEYQEKTIELFGVNGKKTIDNREDLYEFSYKYTLSNGSLWISFYNSKNIEKFYINYEVNEGVNNVTTFFELNQVIELTLFVGGENTPFTREHFIDLIESKANYCNSFEQAEGDIWKYENFDVHGENGLSYLANAFSNTQELSVNGVTRASMPNAS